MPVGQSELTILLLNFEQCIVIVTLSNIVVLLFEYIVCGFPY